MWPFPWHQACKAIILFATCRQRVPNSDVQGSRASSREFILLHFHFAMAFSFTFLDAFCLISCPGVHLPVRRRVSQSGPGGLALPAPRFQAQGRYIAVIADTLRPNMNKLFLHVCSTFCSCGTSEGTSTASSSHASPPGTARETSMWCARLSTGSPSGARSAACVARRLPKQGSARCTRPENR